MSMMRYAMVRGLRCDRESVAPYLPKGYRVMWEGLDPQFGERVVVIGGRDWHGWTLDGYVIPRLGSGMLSATEIDLSHPVMKQVPADA